MNTKYLLLLLAFAPSLYAQKEKIEPKDPILRPAPERAEWTVKITEKFPDSWAEGDGKDEAMSGGQGQAADSVPVKKKKSITYEKDAGMKTYKLVTKWTTGESDEEWIVLGNHVAERSNGGMYIVGAENLVSQELGKFDFPEVSWIDRKNFKRVKTYKGRMVFVFEEAFNRKRMTPTEARLFFFARQEDPKASPMEIFNPRFDNVVVYLDVATQLPVLYNDGSKLYQYEFKKPNSGRLRPPKKVIDFLRQRQADIVSRTTPPAGPGNNK